MKETGHIDNSISSSSSVTIPITSAKDNGMMVHLYGMLSVPGCTRGGGMVVFAHGSGSGRHSPRNQYVARVLNKSGIATLLADLLTADEEKVDNETRRLRFDIPLLASRVSAITDWVVQNHQNTTSSSSIGYFGASTGAAAALVVAAANNRNETIKAIVSRGGRPDLAGSSVLKKVQAATLLIVGGNDIPTITVNQKALQHLLKVAKEKKRLVIVPRAGHLFEEPGTLEEAARHAASWFEKYLLT
jgi:putative phosphoribosyl transferase